MNARLRVFVWFQIEMDETEAKSEPEPDIKSIECDDVRYLYPPRSFDFSHLEGEGKVRGWFEHGLKVSDISDSDRRTRRSRPRPRTR